MPDERSFGADDFLVAVRSPRRYAFEPTQWTCRVCEHKFEEHRVANLFVQVLKLESSTGCVCDDCARLMAAPSAFELLERLRDVFSRSTFAIEYAPRRLDAALNLIFETTRCSHCKRTLVLGTPETKEAIYTFLCEKRKCRAICDTCAESLAPIELSVSQALRQESLRWTEAIISRAASE
jgi:hypothetical protein